MPPPKSIPVRKVKLDGVTWPMARPQEPLIINSQKKLAEVFEDEASQSAVLKLLNLEKNGSSSFIGKVPAATN